MRYQDMRQLMGNISPDVIIEDDNPQSRHNDIAAKLDTLKKSNGNRKKLEDDFAFNWTALEGPLLIREFIFHDTRRWRFDFAVPSKKIAIEIQGGLYAAQSGHRSKEGVERDYEKINEALFGGWQVFQITSDNIKDTRFLQRLIGYIQQARVH